MDTWLNLSTSNKIISAIIGCIAFIIILVCIGLFIYLLKVKKITKDGAEFGNEKEDNSTPETRPTLLKHRFFMLMDMVKIDGFLMPNAPRTDKTIINVIFLRECLFKVINRGIKDFIKDMEQTKGKKLYMLPSTIIQLMDEYTEKAKNIKIDLPSGITLYGVPSCYMGIFNSWNYEHNKVLMDSITDVISDSFYTDWYSKCVSCLDYLYNCYALTIYDANRTLGQLNGNLEAEIDSMVKNQRGSITK